jgi:hypothetical protein
MTALNSALNSPASQRSICLAAAPKLQPHPGMHMPAVSASGMGFPEPYWQLVLERCATLAQPVATAVLMCIPASLACSCVGWQRSNLFRGTLPNTPLAPSHCRRIALTCGIMMWPNIWLLFLPAPQSSFLQALTGIQFTEMIRYHRHVAATFCLLQTAPMSSCHR